MKRLYLILLVFINATNLLATDYVEMGNRYIEISEYDSAITVLNYAIVNCENCQDTTLGYLYLSRGKALKLKEDYNDAVFDYYKGLDYFKKSNYHEGIVYSYAVLAEYYRFKTQYEKAFVYLDKAVGICKIKSISNEKKALLYNRYAAVLNESNGDEVKIIEFSENAINLTKDLNLKASSLREMANVYERSDKSKSIQFYLKSLELYEIVGNKKYVADVMFVIARFYFFENSFIKCVQYCDKGLKIAKQNNWNTISRDLLFYKYKALTKLNDFEESNRVMEEHFHFAFNVAEKQWDEKLVILENEYEYNEKEHQIEIEKAKLITQKKKTKEKTRELNIIILVSALLLIIVFISVAAFFKIRFTNKKLNKTVIEKEVLLQEVHHRVKNNLTVLNSLLYIQADEIVDLDTKRILNESRSRIQSMALVHQNLYNVEDASEVNIDKFIKELISNSEGIYGVNSIVKNIETKNISFDMNFTIFIGLILNELITNSFKYEFNEFKENQLDISIRFINQGYELIYGDNGSGLPSNFDINNSGGFGFKLINMMVRQIKGTIDYSAKNNIFIIKFKS